MKIHPIFTVLFFLFFSIVVLSSSVSKEEMPSLEDLLVNLEKEHGNADTFAVQYRQEKTLSFLEQPVISNGFIIFSVPNNIRYDITDPFQSSMLKNGKKIKRYEYREDKWRELEFSGGRSIQLVMEQIGLWMQGQFDTKQDFFSLSLTAGDPNDFVSLHLTPRHESFLKYIQDIQIHISDPPGYPIRQIDIVESGGDCFSLIFLKELRNIQLPNSCFDDPETAKRCRELFEHSDKESAK